MRGMIAAIVAMTMGVGAAMGAEERGLAWEIPFKSDLGAMSAADLLEAPAGKAGVIAARDGHFFTADGKRIRFWGVNTCFAGDFPTHAQADDVAARLANLGINCVRLHHLDMQKFPQGIFEDDKLEKLSPEAMDRLDYFVAALKKRGVYVNLNLHVSRKWSKTHGLPGSDKLDMDKIADLFYPGLIEPQKQYARDLLTHVNAYTKTRYADEPAVAMMEINNENTLFLWGGDKRIEELPEPYAGELGKLWNGWLVKKYGGREKLKTAWAKGTEALGKNLLADPGFEAKANASPWHTEAHEGATISIVPASEKAVPDGPPAREKGSLTVMVGTVTPTSWHVQFSQGGLALKKGQFYTARVRLTASPLQPGGSGRGPFPIDVGVGQAHAPWANLGLAKALVLPESQAQDIALGFIASADEDNARLSFTLGRKAATYYSFSKPLLAEGGQIGLREDEDPAKGSVARRKASDAVSAARNADWFDFLQQQDEAYFVSMREFLRKDLGVKAPVTGTIGLGALGTLSQSKMDFVDAHAYWDHPQFPRKGWDMKDWLINNTAMVDSPAKATLWHLAATRVAGKPFTVTEYNHSAPNEWQAECVPMIASFAAAQDWDAVFLFAYSHTGKFDKGRMESFFDIEGNTLKLAHVPTAARLFLIPSSGGMVMPPLAESMTLEMNREKSLRVADRYYFQLWDELRGDASRGLAWPMMLEKRIAISFDGGARSQSPLGQGTELTWTEKNMSYFARGAGARVCVLPQLRRESRAGETAITFASSFGTMIMVSADGLPLEKSKRALISVAAKGGNEGMEWNDKRRTIGDQWGKGPMRVEEVEVPGAAALPGSGWRIYSLDGWGKRIKEISLDKDSKPVRWEGALWFEAVR